MHVRDGVATGVAALLARDDAAPQSVLQLLGTRVELEPTDSVALGDGNAGMQGACDAAGFVELGAVVAGKAPRRRCPYASLMPWATATA